VASICEIISVQHVDLVSIVDDDGGGYDNVDVDDDEQQ
jgi:hypothetical protein